MAAVYIIGLQSSTFDLGIVTFFKETMDAYVLVIMVFMVRSRDSDHIVARAWQNNCTAEYTHRAYLDEIASTNTN